MKIADLVAAAFVVALGAAMTAEASVVPALINYQGKLTDADGEPLATGEYDLYFRLWNDAEDEVIGDNLVWGEKHTAVPVVRGMFNVILGAGEPLGGLSEEQRDLSRAFNEPDRWLGVTITSSEVGNEIAPRQQLLSAPYAMRAGGGVPVGSIMPFHSFGGKVSIPAGWKICDGTEIDDPDSPLHGENTPDLTSRFLRGASTSGGTGGSFNGSTGSRNGGANLNDHKHETPLMEDGCCIFRSVINPWGVGNTEYRELNHACCGDYFVTGRWAYSNTPHIDLNSHTHSISLPPYFEVIYIVRIK